MKKYLSIVLVLVFLSSINLLKAEDLLPSESYYKENIAVNEISAESPSLRAPGDVGGIPNPGGETEGNGTHVGGPIGDAMLPLLVAGLFYGSVVLFRNRNRKTSDIK